MTEQFILTLIDKFETGSMREMEWRDGVSSLLLSKNYGALLSVDGAAGASERRQPTGIPTSPPAGTPASLSQSEVDKALNSGQGRAAGEVISSPIVGTFYAAPGPDSPAFVSKGSKVKKGDTLCILEAMKMMNKLEAEFDCEILDIKASPGQLVEFGEPLFEARRL
ncbi:MAG: acetyl-CoA carboxylase biotin carboxyl carrier protein [Spirochaetaceae bacterium]|jgi:acetyl-CoA carboxylase biotin carboxyl carrier protein|nr:acetyl-CoA carboxylase biotin carboxyl carrier protein [Spirochaetaceae bacterium]